MLKKILLGIVLSSVLFSWLIETEANESFKELSVPYETQENCTQERDANNIKHQKYIRSDCFIQGSKYYYYLCNKTSSLCAISWTQILANSSDLEKINPYSVGISSKIILKLKEVSPKIQGLSNKKLLIFDKQLDSAILKYAGREDAIRILNYLKFEVKSITEKRSQLNWSDDFLCEIIWKCKKTGGIKSWLEGAIQKTLAQQDTRANGFWLFSNKTLTGSYNGANVSIVDIWEQLSSSSTTNFPDWINGKKWNGFLKKVNTVYAIRLQTKSATDWVNGNFTLTGIKPSNEDFTTKIVDYTFSKVPWNMGSSEFEGNACISGENGSFALILESINSVRPPHVTQVCVIPVNTYFYLNVNLRDISCSNPGVDCFVSTGISGLVSSKDAVVELEWASVETKDAISITQTTASIRGNIITQNKTWLKAYFNFGISPSNLATTGDISVIPTWSQVYNKRENLIPGTKYYYQAVLKDQDGKIINSGIIKNFTTLWEVVTPTTPPVVIPPVNPPSWPNQNEIIKHEWRSEWNTLSWLQLDSSSGTRIRKWWYTLKSDGSCSKYSWRNIYTWKCTCSEWYSPILKSIGSRSYECINIDTWVVNGSCGTANNSSTLQKPSYQSMCAWGAPNWLLWDPAKFFAFKGNVSQVWGNYEWMYDSLQIHTGENYTWKWSCNGIWPGTSKSNSCSAKYDVVATEAVCGDMHRTKAKVMPTHNLCKVWTIVWSPEYSRGVWRWFCVWEWYWIPSLCRVVKEDRATVPSGTIWKQCETWEGITIKSWNSKYLYNPLTSAHNFSLVWRKDATCKRYNVTCKDWRLQSQEAKLEYNTLWFWWSKWYNSQVSCLKKVPGRNKQISFQTKLGKNKNAHYSYTLNYSDMSNIIMDISRYNSILNPASFNKVLSFNFKALWVWKCTSYKLHWSWQILIGNKNYFQTHLKFCKENWWKLWIYHSVKIKNSAWKYVFGSKVLRHWIIELKQWAQITNVWEFVR